MALADGETIDRALSATLLYGRDNMDGALFLTDRRLLFEAKKSRRRGEEADARWLSVPFTDVKAAALHPAPGASMGLPSSRRQCLFLETAQGEQVWWDFGEREEREWLPLVQERSTALRASESDDSET